MYIFYVLWSQLCFRKPIRASYAQTHYGSIDKKSFWWFCSVLFTPALCILLSLVPWGQVHCFQFFEAQIMKNLKVYWSKLGIWKPWAMGQIWPMQHNGLTTCFISKVLLAGLPGGAVARTLHSQCSGPRFCPWSGNESPCAAAQGLHATTKDSMMKMEDLVPQVGPSAVK